MTFGTVITKIVVLSVKQMYDEIDQKIIAILQKDSRVSNIEIAKSINRSESTVRQRLLKLLQRGVIKRFTIELNPAYLGYNTIAFIGINTHPSKLLRVVKALKKINEVKFLATSTGAFMIMCKIFANDGIHLGEIVEKIEELEGVLEVMPSIIQETHKQE